ncbi:bifunctional riboflavin kinase/FAD synthetase [Phenylobacterium deserti]|uniref:Riboflavin biosynthesis protein n=1 Tax=Phenylobacterium deserti TaxID=1914756 RepID=A0A328ARN6_9CAUL|nr:bifunctional riboflavin kinase/FAD synthetase [Phenylobacterium deserti]RAK57620.1 bifunctional riboflavin kinase/FMN adenylyltransferase [Phenylobacterium deserti]
MSRVRVIRGWEGLVASDRAAAVAMGSFDGVHRGHQEVIALAAQSARALGAPLGVITFDPHPRVFFRPDGPAFRIQKTDQQARALEQLGVEILYVLPWAPGLAELTPEAFAREVLVDGLGVRHVTVGFDNTFGKGRSGSPQALAELGAELGFSVSVAQEVGDEAGKFSSTAIRDALREGRPDDAAAILTRPFAIEGAVERGRQLGRKLGFPTANVPLDDYVVPKFGVYATRTRLPDGRELPGVANIGVNPTITGTIAPRLEVWLFDFDEDIYDQVIETDLIAFLRPEEKFDGLEALTEQVMADAAAARALLRA